MSVQRLDRIQFVTRHFNELQGLRYGVPLGLLTLSVGGTTYFANRSFLLLRALFLLGGLFLMLYAGRYYRRAFGVVERQPVRPAIQLQSLSIYSPAGPAPRLEAYELLKPVTRRLLIAMTLGFVLLLALRAYSPAVEISTDESLIQKPWLSLHSDVNLYLADKPFPGESWSTFRMQLLYALCGSLFLGVWLWRGFRLSQGYYLALGVLLLGLSAYGAVMGFFWSASWDQGIFNFLLPAAAHLWIALLLCGSAMILTGLLDHWQLVRAFGTNAMEETA
jgi:hypothetical protein